MSFKDRFGMSFVAMLGIILGVFMAILDNTIVNVAIPKMISVFSTTQTHIEWVITAYLLVTGMLTPMSGYLGDRFGQKQVYLAALTLFTTGSALCGLSWNADVIIVFRIWQAIGGAMLMPTSMTLLFSMAPPQRRGAIMGIWGIALMFAPALGPTLSGYLVQYVDWRLIFYINVPIGIICFLLVVATIPTLPGAGKADPPDWAGFITSLVGFFSLLYALSEAPTDGWSSITILSFLVLAGIALSAFVVIELTTDHPMLDLRLLGRRVYLMAIVTTSLLNIALLGVLFLLPVFLQEGIGLTPLQTGLLTLPGALLTGALMPVSGVLFDRIGARPLGIVGLGVLAVTSFMFTNIDYNWTFSWILLLYMFRSVGMGIAMMPLSTAGMNDVPQHLISRGTALQNTMRNVAGSIGTAWMSTIMQTGAAQHFVQYVQRLSVQHLQTIRVFSPAPSVYGVTTPGALNQLVTMLDRWAFQSGMQDAFYLTALLTVIAWVSVFFIGKKRAPVASGFPGKMAAAE